MNSNSEAPKYGQQAANQMEMNSQQRDRFELLSAYLDGEATAAERKQVQQWLDNDPTTKKLYHRLLKLRHGLQTMPIPREQSVDELQKQVFAAQTRRHFKRLGMLGGGAIAAVVIGAISVVLPGSQSPIPQIASLETKTESNSVAIDDVQPLMIAINGPAIEIPKAAISSNSQ